MHVVQKNSFIFKKKARKTIRQEAYEPCDYAMVIAYNDARCPISSPFRRPMPHRTAHISVSIALGHASANAVKATAGDWSTGSSVSLTFPLHSHMSSARREGSEYHF